MGAWRHLFRCCVAVTGKFLEDQGCSWQRICGYSLFVSMTIWLLTLKMQVCSVNSPLTRQFFMSHGFELVAQWHLHHAGACAHASWRIIYVAEQAWNSPEETGMGEGHRLDMKTPPGWDGNDRSSGRKDALLKRHIILHGFDKGYLQKFTYF